MWKNTTESDRGANEGVELLVTANGELEMAWRDTLDLEILGSVACKLKNFGRQVLEYSREVDAGFGADARLLARDGAKVTLYATARELK